MLYEGVKGVHVVKGSFQRDVFGEYMPLGQDGSLKLVQHERLFKIMVVATGGKGRGGHLKETKKLNLSAARMFWCISFDKVLKRLHLYILLRYFLLNGQMSPGLQFIK